MLNQVNMDFRIPESPHSVVKHAQCSRVRELIQKIENHPDRHALQQDLRQNQAYNPFSPESKQMLQEVGNIELFELLETDPKTKCKACLSYWSAGIVYCTCGHLLKETVANRGFIVCTLDLLSIPEYVIKKGRPHGHRYGEKPGDKEYFRVTSWRRNAKRETTKESMTDSYEIMFSVDEWLQTVEMKKFVEHGMFLHMKITLIICHKKNTSTTGNKWWLHLFKSGNDTLPLRKRSDFNQALSTLERLHQEAGEQIEPMPHWKYKHWKPASSSSSTWWEWQDSWWSS